MYIEQARQSYHHVLDLHPAALVDHAVGFMSGFGGEPKRALSLRFTHLERRPTQRAYVVAMEIAEAAGENVSLCFLAQDVSPAHMSMVLKGLVARPLEEC